MPARLFPGLPCPGTSPSASHNRRYIHRGVTFHRTYSPFHHSRATMAFAVSTQALAAKVALSGKTINVRKNAAKAVRNTSVRAAVSAPAVSKYSSSRQPPRLAHLARSFARDRPRFRPHARDNSRGRVRASSARPVAASSSRARHRARRVPGIGASSLFSSPEPGKGLGLLSAAG